MAYTYEQLRLAYAAVHGGIEPTSEVASQLVQLTTDAAITDAQRMSYILNSADDSTSVAVLTYQFFTGKSPTAAGVGYLVNSTTNAADLSDAYYAPLNLENRFMNFAGNLALVGEARDAFASQYGAMSFTAYVAQIYDTIIGDAQARAVGLDPAAIILDIIARRDSLLTAARSAGMISDTSTQAEIDLALKAATAAYLLAEGIKADVGIYAASTNNFMLDLAKGEATYNTNITETYKPTVTSGSSGKGVAVDNPPDPVTLPGGPSDPNPPTQEPEPSSRSFTLTGGADTFTGETLSDTFSATHLTFNATDALDGGAGADSLTITATTGATYALPAASVTSIETVTISNDSGLTGDISAWTGLTQLNTTASGQYGLTLAGSTNLKATINAQGSNAFAIDGGKALDVTITGATTSTLDIGATIGATGAIKISRETTGAVTAGQINVTGGTTVSVTQTATNAVGTTQINGAVKVTGAATTTEVTVKASKAVSADGATAGITANTVTILDTASSATVGSITKATVDGYTTLAVTANALSTLSLANGSGNINITNASGLATNDKTTTLNLALNGVTGGALSDSNVYKTLNITTGARASTLANIADTALTTLNIDGASALTLTSASGMTGLQTVKISGAAGLTGTLTNGTLTAVDASGTTGDNTLTLNAARASFTGGSGSDSITFSSTSLSKTYALGDGDDTVTFASGTSSVTGTISGGAGVDTLKMIGGDAYAVSLSSTFATKVTGFERLLLTSAPGARTIDLAKIGVQDWVTTAGGASTTFSNMNSGGTLELNGAGTSYGLSNTAFSTGVNDTINVKLTSGSGAAVAFASTGITATNVETINLTSTDTQATPSGTFSNTVTLLGSSVTTVTVGGNAGLALTADSTALSSLDASGLTLGGLTWTSGALTGAATIKGSATGANTVTFSAATGGAVTYVGGAGNDTITGANGRDNVVSLGGGTNSYTGGTGSETISVGNGANTINVGTGSDTVTITGANASSASVFTTVTGFGAGDKLGLSAQGGAGAATTLGAEITGQTTLAAYLDAAAAGDGHGAAQMKWFRFGGDTYVVLDSGAGSTFTAGTDIVAKLAGNVDLTNATVSNGTLVYAAPPASSFVLTTGVDDFTGGSLNDTFTGTHLTFNATDTLDGGAGADSLTITATTGATYALPAASVANIETATISNDSGLAGDVRTWTGLTQLNTNTSGHYELKLAGSTSLTATIAAQGSNGFAIDGGKTLDVTITGATTPNLDIGATTAATGAVKISRETTGAVTAGQINITGGTTITVTQTATNAVNSTQTNGAVTVNGTASTTEITVKAAKAATADGSTAGITANTVAINDINKGSTTLAGTITKASVDGYSTLVFKGTALTDLSLAHGAGDITIDNSGLSTPTNKTLSLGLNGVTGGVLDDADIYTTLNVTTGAEASTLTDITLGALATLNLDGASQLKLTGTPSLAALTTVKISGVAGLNANLTTPSLLTSIDASGTSGANTLTINGSRTAFTGGSGVDTVTHTGTTITKAIDLGAGDDVLTLSTTATATINGGAGTDTLVTDASTARSLLRAGQVTGFERLYLTSINTSSVDVSGFGFNRVTLGEVQTGRFTLGGLASGNTVELTSAATQHVFNGVDFTGVDDVLNLVLTHQSQAINFASAGILIDGGLETLNIQVNDTGAAPDGSAISSLRVNSTGMKTIAVTGNGSLSLTSTTTSLTNVDASGVTLGGFTWTSAALTGAATIKGSATGTNTVTFSAATGGAITYVGGTGNDVITGANSRDNVISLGGGTNSYTGGTGSETITVGNGANTINVGTGSDTVNVTAANASSASVFTTVTNFGTGDKLSISAQGGAAAATTLGAKLTGQTTLAAYLDAATAGDRHGTARMNWFQFGGDTYVVLDSGAGATFTAGTDIVTKLTGLVDLAGSSVTNGTLIYGAPPPASQSFVLTTGVDTLTGGAPGDTFTGTHLTFNATDTLDGGAGADSLTVTATTGSTYAIPAASVTGIETFTLSNDAGLVGDLRGWTGLTQLNTTSSADLDLKLAGSTGLTATVNAQGAGALAIDGGKALDLTITGATTATLNIGATTAATDAVKVSRETTGAVAAGQITVNGGTTVSITQTATNATGTIQTNGAVTVNGAADTTSVTVKAAKAATANGSTAGIAANTVAINDINKGSTAQAGTITKASVDGYSTLTFKGTALTDLTLGHGASNVTIDNSGLSTPTNKTLNLALNGVTGGTLDDADIYTTLNVTTGAEASTLDNVTFAALATLNLDGASQMKLTSTPSLAALTTVKISGAASLNANLTTPSLLTSIDASGTSGANTLTINGGRTAFTGGSGVDTITLSGTTISNTIDLGAGDDVLTLASGTTALSAPLKGGAGTDTLVMAAADAVTASQSTAFGSQLSGFERLEIQSFTSATVDAGALGFSYIILNNVQGTFTLNNFASGGTLELTDPGRVRNKYNINSPDYATGANDVLNLVLNSLNGNSEFAFTGFNVAAGVETINIRVNDISGSPNASSLPSLRLGASSGLKSIFITGNSGFELATSPVDLTLVDASGITLGGFTWTSGALINAATIKGASTGANTVIFSAATSGAITYVGGAGNDTITGANGRDNVISLGGGTNSYTGGTGSETITVGNGANTINVGTGAGLDTVNVTAANAASATVFTSVTNFGNGDKLNISAQGGAAAATTLGAEVTGQSTLAAYLDAAAAGDGHGTALMNWFRFGGDTYVVLDSGAGSAFTAGTDIVVKLVGAVDLQVSHVSGGALTYTVPI